MDRGWSMAKGVGVVTWPINHRRRGHVVLFIGRRAAAANSLNWEMLQPVPGRRACRPGGRYIAAVRSSVLTSTLPGRSGSASRTAAAARRLGLSKFPRHCVQRPKRWAWLEPLARQSVLCRATRADKYRRTMRVYSEFYTHLYFAAKSHSITIRK